ncbi:MAG: quinoprotein relay system zinc metallohydrolase 2 [Geminicoccales bacterium]
MTSLPFYNETREKMTRRDTLVMGGVLAATSLAAPRCLRAASDPVALESVSEGAYVHQGAHEIMQPDNLGHIANVGFIIGDDSVAVIDSGGSAMHGRHLREVIQSKTDRPIRYVIATHVHPDHLFGHAAFLQDDPIFVGHHKLPGALDARGAFYLDNLNDEFGVLASGTEVVKPDLLVEDEMILDLGNRPLTLKAHATAHTDNDLSVLDQRDGLLWAGDLLFMERCPVLDGRLLGWLDVLDELQQIEAKMVVPGHGPISAAWPDALGAERRYLTRLRDEVRDFLAGGGLLDDVVETLTFEDERAAWQLFDEYHGRNVSAAYAELEWE